MSDPQREIVLIIWEDCRKLIAGLKKQRWSVTQWVVTVNLGLSAAASSKLVASSQITWLFLLFELGVSCLGAFLLWHYNEQITRRRSRLTKVIEYVGKTYFDFNGTIGLDVGGVKSPEHDKQELVVFYSSILGSLLPIVAITTGILQL